jgi:hypothetical protein
MQEKHAVATQLRDAFEIAEPLRNKGQFLLLDWKCLELVEEVCLFHTYGPLTRRYLSDLPKLGPRQYDTYSDHIDDLIAVIGRQTALLFHVRDGSQLPAKSSSLGNC